MPSPLIPQKVAIQTLYHKQGEQAGNYFHQNPELGYIGPVLVTRVVAVDPNSGLLATVVFTSLLDKIQVELGGATFQGTADEFFPWLKNRGFIWQYQSVELTV